MSVRPRYYGILSGRPIPNALLEWLVGPLTDSQRERLRKTGRSIYGKPPYCITEEEKKQWGEARASRKETH